MFKISIPQDLINLFINLYIVLSVGLKSITYSNKRTQFCYFSVKRNQYEIKVVVTISNFSAD